MSEFLAKVSAKAESLGDWVRASVGEMDRIMDEGFPGVFGDDWRSDMRHFKTPERTKLLTYVFGHALKKTAPGFDIPYRTFSNEGAGGNNYNCCVFGYEARNTLNLGKEATVFATGNNFMPGNAKRVLAIKVRLSECYKTEGFFAAFVDLPAEDNGDSRWHIPSGRSGFSSLKVACRDERIIVPLCGNIRTRQKYVGTEYESFHSRGG